jgi:hypothetical protein
MSIRVNRVLFFCQRLVSEQYLDPTATYTVAPVPAGMPDPLKANYKATVAADYAALRLEYSAMM